MLLATRLAPLHWLDIVVIVVYFVAVLGLGFLLQKQTDTSEDFFLAGRDMSAWVAGVSFLAANMGALELMGGPLRPISMAFWPRIGTGSALFRQCCFWR